MNEYNCCVVQTLSRRPLIALNQVWARAYACENLWRTKWQWDRVFSECVGFPLSVSFHQFSSGWRSNIETGFSSSVLVFPCQYHSTSSPLAGEVTFRLGCLRVYWFSPASIIPPVLLWWAKWHWDRVFFECVGFPLSLSFHQFSSGGRSDTETGVSSSVLVFPRQYHSTSSPYFYSSSKLLVTEQQTSNAWGPSNKLMLIRKSVSMEEEKYFRCEYFKWIFV